MHVPETEGKILSLKVRAQKGSENHILEEWIHISKNDKTYAEAMLGGELYEVKMKVIPSFRPHSKDITLLQTYTHGIGG